IKGGCEGGWRASYRCKTCGSVGGGPARLNSLEHQLHAQLNLTRARHIAASCTRHRNLAELRRRILIHGLPEVRVIEDVEHFRAKLQKNALVNLGVLGRGKIKIHQAWSPQDIAPGISKARRRLGERVLVEKLRGRGIIDVKRLPRNQVGAIESHEASF